MSDPRPSLSADALRERLRPFLDAGLVQRVPTRVQIAQGELEMWPWVISTDVTDEARYAGAPLGHPWLRQPVIFARAGLDHLRIGTGLGARLSSVITHLHFTFHRGMPVWDLQVVQTHPGGLDRLEHATAELIAGTTPPARRALRQLTWILPEPERYLRRFLGEDGWIVRARELDYPSPAENGAAELPAEFHSLADFLVWAEATFPAHLSDVPAHRWPGRVLHHGTRRFREGRGFGWFFEPGATR